MRRLNRYISRTVLVTIFITLFVLAGLDVLSLIISESRSLKGDYTFERALAYVAWKTPSTLIEHLTYAAFLGSVIGLGIHASANELVVIRAAGVGMKRIMWAVLRPAILLSVVALLLNEYVTPFTLQQAAGVQALAKSGRALEFGQGNWHLENNTFMHFRGLNRNLFDVTRYQFGADRKRLLASSFADQAVFQEGKWYLENEVTSRFVRSPANADGSGTAGQRVDVIPAQRVMRQEFAQSSEWRTELSPQFLNDLVLPVEALSIRSLYNYAAESERQGLESQVYWLSFWQKTSLPLVIIGLTLVGISFVFGSLREMTVGQRLTIAVLVGYLFNTLQDLLAESSLVFEFSPVAAVFVPIVLCFVVGILMLRRT